MELSDCRDEHVGVVSWKLEELWVICGAAQLCIRVSRTLSGEFGSLRLGRWRRVVLLPIMGAVGIVG